ncbi:MAG: cyclic nucleotide-binding domain-containing protein [Candidatus Gracilibacteria bacterium]|jgi:CRP/FNR family transcriptional regulator
MKDLKETLKKCFFGLEGEELEMLFNSLNSLCEIKRFMAGDVVFKEGDRSSELYIVIEGKVQIVKGVSGGGMKIFAVLDHGGIFGEGALLSDKGRGASAQALSDVSLCVLRREDFNKFLKQNPAYAAGLLIEIVKVVNSRLQYVNSELIALYDVMRILGTSPDDLRTVASEVLKKFIQATECKEGVIFLHNLAMNKEDVLAVSEGASSDFIAGSQGVAGEKAKVFMGDSSLRYQYENGMLWLGIKNFSGKFFGFVVLKDSEDGFPDDQIKLALAIAEQLGTFVERHYGIEGQKERMRLKEERVGF